MVTTSGPVPEGRLPKAADGRATRLFREAERLWAQRADLRAAFPDIECWDFWYWLILEEYGSTFILDSYVGAKWTDLFHVVSWHAAPDDWQDYVILRRRPGRPHV